MKKLGILVVVLAMCLPAYGYILVYKLAASATSADFENEPYEPNGWLLQKGSGSGYLVLEVYDEDPNMLSGAEYIDYYTDKEDGKTQKEYDIWDPCEDFARTILPGLPPKGKNITALNLDLWGHEDSLCFTGWLLGTNSLTDIGTRVHGEKTKVDVATSLKGSFKYISGENLDTEEETLDEQGTGTVTLTLDSKWTKIANDPCEAKGFDGSPKDFLSPESGPNMPRGLVNWLEQVKKYVLWEEGP
jgi:hypothetical protein